MVVPPLNSFTVGSRVQVPSGGGGASGRQIEEGREGGKYGGGRATIYLLSRSSHSHFVLLLPCPQFFLFLFVSFNLTNIFHPDAHASQHAHTQICKLQLLCKRWYSITSTCHCMSVFIRHACAAYHILYSLVYVCLCQHSCMFILDAVIWDDFVSIATVSIFPYLCVCDSGLAYLKFLKPQYSSIKTINSVWVVTTMIM